MSTETVIEFTRRMQGKPEDVERQLPEALGDRPGRALGDGRFEFHDDESRRIELDVTPVQDKELGSLELPMLQVDFVFEGYEAEEVERIMDHFDTYTLRVGGGP